MLSRWMHQLEDIRIRGRVLALWRALAFGLAAALLWASAAMLIGRVVSAPALRALLYGLSPVVGLVVLYVCGTRRLRRLSPLAVARATEHVYPQLGGRLVTAVELKVVRGQAGSDFIYSRELAEAYLDAVDAEIPDLDPARVFSPREAGKAALLSVGALLLCCGVLLSQGKDARLAKGPASEGGEEAAATVALDSASVHYEYPAYSGLGTDTVLNSDGNVQALKGTHVTLDLTLRPAVASADLVLPSGDHVPMTETQTGGFRTAFVLSDAGDYHVKAVTDAQEHVRLPERTITIDPDRPPSVAITRTQPPVEAARTVEIDPAGLLELRFRASDDYGLSAARLAVSAAKAGKPEFVAQMSLETAEAERAFSWKVTEEFSKLREPVFYVWVEVDDNDTISGPKTSRTPPLTVRLITPERRHEQIIALQRILLQRMVELLGDYLESETPREVSAFVANQNKVRSRIGNVIELGRTCMRLMKSSPLADYNVYKVLEEFDDHRMDELGHRQFFDAPMTDESGRLASSFVKSWQTRLAREIVILESDILVLDDYIKSQEMALIRALGKRIEESRKRLEELMARLKEGNLDDAMKAEIAREIEALQRRIMEMAARMNRLAQQLPSEFVNRDALPREQSREVQSLMEQMKKALAEGRQEDALKLAAELARKFENSVAGMQDGMQQWAARARAGDLEKMRKLQKQLSGIQREQRRLTEQTGGIREKHQKRATESLESLIDRDIERIRKHVRHADELTEEIEQTLRRQDVPQPPGLPAPRVQTDDLTDHWRELDKQLERKELFEASRRAEQATTDVDQWHQDELRKRTFGRRTTDQEAERTMPREAERLQAQAEKIDDAIHNLLQKIQQAADSSAAMREARQMSELAGEQAQVARQTQQLQDQVKKLSEKHKGAGGRIGQGLEKSRQWMEKAEQTLDDAQVSNALEAQKQALEALDRIGEQLGEQVQRMGDASQMQRRPMPSRPGRRDRNGRYGMSEDKVDIPNADAHRPSRRFRDDIMKILSDGLPEAYQKENEEYYRSLVE